MPHPVYKKPHLPSKRCATCGRPFHWRRKWREVWAEVRYCSVMRVKDGMVVEGRDYYDSATISRQLGLID